ncbi:DUF2182 domain-containing protein [Actinomycetospora cinnamomea]|uniref:Putative metal-binding membrane protein n=1 Tax=Actinomycetospora cinnamomea TaxID=663609 RepID=A0A2U1FDZ2_9PSEU|nr:DUF2182 domain-containing protein [Actinomycetospora cinnamomea]PVZ10180.1 putative metal-binding membrane protein [Actinomycetospora cinnamomea]
MSVLAPRRTRRAPTPSVTTAVLGVAAAAWVGVVVSHTGGTPHAHHADAPADVAALLTTLAGWALMVLAMMLPPALPLVGLLRALLSRRGHVAWRLAVALAAFVGVWLAVGVVLVTGGFVIETVLSGSVAPATHLRVAGGLVVLAGAYQFTPVKNACLTACRTPRWFALRFWGRRSPTLDAATVASAYGVSCVGCCWALMLLCLGTGALALPVMVVLTAVMAAERLVPRAHVIARTTGVVLLLLGTALLAGFLPPALVHPLLGA